MATPPADAHVHWQRSRGWTALALARHMEGLGFPTVAVPAFLPLDMQAPKKGMRGEICLRRAGVRAGLGSYGENGLLVTRAFGSVVRLSAVVTQAELSSDPPPEQDACRTKKWYNFTHKSPVSASLTAYAHPFCLSTAHLVRRTAAWS